jgi:hypothetical protein
METKEELMKRRDEILSRYKKSISKEDFIILCESYWDNNTDNIHNTKVLWNNINIKIILN